MADLQERKIKDAQMRATINQKLVETGERERLKELLRTRLIECGWRDQLKAQCKDADRTVEAVTDGDLTPTDPSDKLEEKLFEGITMEQFASFDDKVQVHPNWEDPSTCPEPPKKASSEEENEETHEEQPLEPVIDFKTALQHMHALKLFALRHIPSLTDTFLSTEFTMHQD